MITEQGNSVDYTTAIALNDTAVFLIQSTEGKEFTAEDWVQLLTENYEVDEEIARKDVDSLIASLHEIGIIA